MRLYITGVSGFVGTRLAEAWTGRHELAGCSRQSVPWLSLEHHSLDLAEEPRSLVDRLEAFRPDWVIHCAAVSRPILFAQDPAGCRRVNVEAGHWLADWCRRRDRGLIAFSSDTVYPDAAECPAPAAGWSEASPTGPVHQYGLSKADLEQVVLERLPAALLLRSSLLWGRSRPGQNSFSGWLLTRYRENPPVPVFRDNRRNLLAAGALPGILERLLDLVMTGGEPARELRGPLNLGSADYLSREDFARRLLRQLALEEAALEPLDTAKAALPEPLARELPLDLTRLRGLLGELPTTEDWLPREYPNDVDVA
jgi:dTDP-4-dehydrorhamnose reductase